MKLPPELEDHYVKEVLYNRLLENLPDEEWKLIEGYENYAISNYGRVKSLERESQSLFGKERLLPEIIIKLGFTRYFNKYLKLHFYNVHCGLSQEGKKTMKPISRLVYYHFVEKFDMNDQHIYIETKDNNRLHVHSSNLRKTSASERSLKTFKMNKAKNRHTLYLQPISQYTTGGEFVADFDSFYAAEKAFGIEVEAIYHAIFKKTLVAGAHRWFLQSNPPQEKDFTTTDNSGRLLNNDLWKRLGRPSIDKKNPPACMNLSIENLPEEQWKPIPNFERRFFISDKGRVKRGGEWNIVGRKVFKKDQILSQFVEFKNETQYSMGVLLDDAYDKKKKTHIEIARLLYYCFIEKFDLTDKTVVVINENDPQWKVDLTNLVLRPVKDTLDEKKIKSIRIILNSKKTFNYKLWEKLGKPFIDKKNPPAIMNLSLIDLPDEHWKSLPGYEGKYVISNCGRVKRLSGWKVGIQFFAEEQILSVNMEKDNSYFSFRVHEQLRRSSISITRNLYFCFVEEFDLNDRTLIVVNHSEPLWDLDLSKLTLEPRN